MAWLLVVGLAAVSGVAMIAIAVHKLKEAGEGNPQTKASQAFSYGAIGGILISLPSALQAAVDTLGLGAVEADAIATAGEIRLHTEQIASLAILGPTLRLHHQLVVLLDRLGVRKHRRGDA